MKRVAVLSERIRDAVNAEGHVLGDTYFKKRSDEFMRLCVAMDTFGDATLALEEFESGGLGADDADGELYLRFYGMFQAIILQQDAIAAIDEAIFRNSKAQGKKTSWQKIRDLRNLATGHPTDRKTGVPGKRMRSFVPRIDIGPENFSLLIWDETSRKLRSQDVDFAKVYAAYKDELVSYAEDVLGRIDALRLRFVRDPNSPIQRTVLPAAVDRHRVRPAEGNGLR